MARWVKAEDRKELERFLERHKVEMATDKDGDPVYLAESSWWLQHTQKDWPTIAFVATKERA